MTILQMFQLTAVDIAAVLVLVFAVSFAAWYGYRLITCDYLYDWEDFLKKFLVFVLLAVAFCTMVGLVGWAINHFITRT